MFDLASVVAFDVADPYDGPIVANDLHRRLARLQLYPRDFVLLAPDVRLRLNDSLLLFALARAHASLLANFATTNPREPSDVRLPPGARWLGGAAAAKIELHDPPDDAGLESS